MIARVDRLGDQGGVLCKPLVTALGSETRGFVAQQDDDLALHVEAGIVVIAKFGGSGAVAGEDDRGGGLARGGEAEGDKIFVQFENFLFAAYVFLQIVARD